MPGKIEERLESLRQLRSSATTDGGAHAVPALRKALSDRSNLIAAEAAKISADLICSELIPDLLAALARFFEDPVKTDPKCWGKTAIIRSLAKLDYSESLPFLRASRHIQMEPVWGGQEDAAISLRATAILALVQCADLSRAEILRHLVDGFADASEKVRIEAVRALEQMNGEESPVLLRLKAHSGDKEAAVIGQVFDSLLALEREHAVDFVAEFMKSASEEIRDEATLSLGASRLAPAVEILMRTWKEARSRDFGSVLLRAISSSREEPALEFLLDLVRIGLSRDADAALEALALHQDSHDIKTRVEQARRERAGSSA